MTDNNQNTKAASRKHESVIPKEVEIFTRQDVDMPISMTANGWRAGLRETEIVDNKQKIKARPYLAWGVGALLALQNLGIWFIVVWALNKQELGNLQLIFSALIGGTLAQSYLLLKLITEKVFGDINYHIQDAEDKHN